MKRLLLTLLAVVFVYGATELQAQCTPDPDLAGADAGVYPLPDDIGSTTSVLDTGCIGLDYYQLFTAVVPETIEVELTPGNPLTAQLISVELTDIESLPPGVDSYVCDPPDCKFLQNSTGCVAFTGTPTTAGTFFPVVKTKGTFDIGTGPITLDVSFPSQAGELEIYPGEYKITVLDSNSPDAACTVSTEDVIEDRLGVRQNIPNPFNTITNITVDSKESGLYEFKVFSLVGEMVHNETINFSSGENTIIFDGSLLNSGMYFYTVGQGSDVVTKRMVVN